MGENPIERVKAPKGKSVERQAYAPDVIDALRDAQPSLRDQIAVQLLGRLALRRNELRLLKVGDFDMGRGTVRVHGKGGKIAVLPLGFKTLKRDLEVYLVGRGASEYLLYPKDDTTHPMNPASVHDLVQALPEACGAAEYDQDARASAFGRRQSLARDGQPHDGPDAAQARIASDHSAIPAPDTRGPRSRSRGSRVSVGLGKRLNRLI